MVLNPEKNSKNLKKIIMAAKIHPIFEGLATPTYPSTIPEQTLPFEGCSLCDIIRGLSVEMSTEKPSFLPFFNLYKN